MTVHLVSLSSRKYLELMKKNFDSRRVTIIDDAAAEEGRRNIDERLKKRAAELEAGIKRRIQAERERSERERKLKDLEHEMMKQAATERKPVNKVRFDLTYIHRDEN